MLGDIRTRDGRSAFRLVVLIDLVLDRVRLLVDCIVLYNDLPLPLVLHHPRLLKQLLYLQPFVFDRDCFLCLIRSFACCVLRRVELLQKDLVVKNFGRSDVGVRSLVFAFERS